MKRARCCISLPLSIKLISNFLRNLNPHKLRVSVDNYEITVNRQKLRVLTENPLTHFKLENQNFIPPKRPRIEHLQTECQRIPLTHPIYYTLLVQKLSSLKIQNRQFLRICIFHQIDNTGDFDIAAIPDLANKGIKIGSELR